MRSGRDQVQPAFGDCDAETDYKGSRRSRQLSDGAGGTPQRPAAPVIVLLTPKEAAKLLKVSLSWLAKPTNSTGATKSFC
jgi:hypothetical protein